MAYPPTLPAGNRVVGGPDPVADFNALRAAVADIITELGSDPSGGYATVQEWLSGLVVDKQDVADLAVSVLTIVGGMVSGNSETGVIVTYDPGTGKLDFAPGSTPTRTQSTLPYTLVAADANTRVRVNVATAGTITVPSSGFTVGDAITIYQVGLGQVSFTNATGAILRSRGNALKLAGQDAEAVLTYDAAARWVLSGDVTV